MKNLSRILTLILLLTFLLTFVACSNADDEVRHVYGVYIKSATVENDVCTVRLSFEESSWLVGKASVDTSVQTDSFFERYTYVIVCNGKAIFSAVENALTQDGTLLNGQEYSTLKIIYDYDTINKSVKSGGRIVKVDDKYIHSFDVEDAPFSCQLTRDIPRQSVWYAVAISGAVVLVVLGLTLTYIRGKYGRQKEEN